MASLYGVQSLITENAKKKKIILVIPFLNICVYVSSKIALFSSILLFTKLALVQACDTAMFHHNRIIMCLILLLYMVNSVMINALKVSFTQRDITADDPLNNPVHCIFA